MSPTSSRTRHPGHLVTAVVICRDGATMLASTLDALRAQTRAPERVVAVDLGSSDATVEVATERLGRTRVVELSGPAGLEVAVPAALTASAGRNDRRAREEGRVDWIWILHDDSAPEPDALDELLVRVTQSPSVWLAGPKVLGWDDETLLQAGLTIEPGGHVETGLDRREPDQGQRDDVDEVLAVGAAGSLIRREVWEQLGGTEPAWAEYAADVDLGWRVNALGGRVVVVPRAVLRHAEVECPGDWPAGGLLRAQMVRRRNGMQIVLANTAGWLVPVLVMRYVAMAVLRALALLVLSRQPRQAAAELYAVAQLIAAPNVVRSARRGRDAAREVAHADLRRLFPPAGRWLTALLTMRPQGALDTPVGRRRVAVESGPVSEEAESLGDELSVVAEFIRRPASLLLVGMSLLSLVANRHILSGSLHGGGLLPAPGGAGDLWSAYVAGWHPTSVGSNAAAPPSLALLALLSTVLLGKAWLAVDVLVLGAVPLAALSAFTALRMLTPQVRVRVWSSVVYALLPAVTGAVSSGRLDVLVAAILLPRVVRAVVLALLPVEEGSARGRCVRAGLWLAVATAFAPLLWLFALVVLAATLAVSRRTATAGGPLPVALPDLVRRAAGVLAIAPLVLLPWTWSLLAHPGRVLAGVGLPEFYASRSAPSGVALALLHAGGTGQPPVWIGVPLLAVVVLGLQRASRVATARIGAAVFALGLVVAIAETRGAGVVAGAAASRHWPGLALLVAGAGALTTGVVAAIGARPALRGHSFGWRQPTVVALVGLAVVATGTLLVGWVLRGDHGPLRGDDPSVLPLYVQGEIQVPTAGRALVLDGSRHLISYALVRDPLGPHLGSGDLPSSGGSAKRASEALTAAVRDLVAARPGAAAELVPFGINYVFAPPPTARRIAPQLGQASALTALPVPEGTVWHSTLSSGELTVLAGPAATAAMQGQPPTAAPAAVLQPGRGALDATFPAGSGTRLLVLAEPASSHWDATVAGKSLHRVTAYGWAQAFQLPSDGGRVDIHYDATVRHLWLVAELLALIGVILFGAGASYRPRLGVAS